MGGGRRWEREEMGVGRDGRGKEMGGGRRWEGEGDGRGKEMGRGGDGRGKKMGRGGDGSGRRWEGGKERGSRLTHMPYAMTNLFEHHIYGAASVDVNKVHLHLTVEELSTAGHAVSKGATHLHPKEVLTLMSLHQSPLALLTLRGRGEGGRREE